MAENPQFSINRYPNTTRRLRKDGTYHYYKNTTTIRYNFKLHHPDAAEVDLIRADVAGGMTIRAAMAKYAIGSYTRYYALMKKFPAAGTVEVGGDGAAAAGEDKKSDSHASSDSHDSSANLID